MKKPEIRWLR